MYKALITDLDGTAVKISSDGSDVDGKTRYAVKLAQQRGVKLACATGREWELAKPVIERFGFISPCIIEGGTRIVEPATGETLWERYLDAGIPMDILAIFKREARTAGEDKPSPLPYTAGVGTPHMAGATACPRPEILMISADTTRQPLHSVDVVPDKLRFMYLLAVSERVATRICNVINVSGVAIAHMTPSWDGGGLVDIHVTHVEATKEHAIQVWQEMEHVSRKETIGLGDSGNDLPIFQSAGFKVAVENATPELKQLADYIAPSVYDDGLVHVIDRFLLQP